MDPRYACSTDVFTTLDQVKTCADSTAYKRSSAIRYGVIGFIVSLFLASIIMMMFFTSSDNDTSNKPITYDAKGNTIASSKSPEVPSTSILKKLIFVGIVSVVTYFSYSYGYDQADYNTVLMAYQEDKREIDSRENRFKSRQDAIDDLANDRRNERAAYNQGRHTSRLLYNNNVGFSGFGFS